MLTANNYSKTNLICTHVTRKQVITRAMFETPKYPWRPKYQYTAHIVNILELSAPPPNRGREKTLQPCNQPGEDSNNKYICNSNKLVVLWTSRFVKQSSDLKTSSIPLRSDVTGSPTVNGGQVCHLWLFCWYRSFAMCICTNIYGSVAFPVLLHYRKSASLLKRSVSVTSIS